MCVCVSAWALIPLSLLERLDESHLIALQFMKSVSVIKLKKVMCLCSHVLFVWCFC